MGEKREREEERKRGREGERERGRERERAVGYPSGRVVDHPPFNAEPRREDDVNGCLWNLLRKP
jgi:hypothetical protein